MFHVPVDNDYTRGMSPQLQKLFAEARQLSAQERVALANELFESTEEDFPDEEAGEELHAEWTAEIQRREAELDSGIVKPIAHEEAMRLMFGSDDG